MNSNESNLNKLRSLIYTSLDPLIQSDYSLLDIPDYKNIGDHLIWGGELAFLKRLPYNMSYSANWIYCQLKDIPTSNTILLQGGGNFGDIWRHHQEFRLKIISNFKQSKIVVFPQTVYYKDVEILKKDAAVFNQHPNLTVCARDAVTYEILKKYFHKNNIIMLPDMAFCLDLTEHIQTQPTNKVLLLERNDKELQQKLDIDNLLFKEDKQKQLEIRDWPRYNQSRLSEAIENTINSLDIKISKRLIKVPVINQLIDPRHGMKRRDARTNYISNGIKFINRYDTIYTTRLHGYILSVLLNKQVYMLDNSYGKNSGFYNTWMKDFEKSVFLGSVSKQQTDNLQGNSKLNTQPAV
ncbi:polysaccharide pyruvyl transferase family protein [Deminuibacter soli]|nr:polysaccharide pyruvyl transferase family protein [Deminuibacter soli]